MDLEQMLDLAAWQQVPNLVRYRLKLAAALKQDLEEALADLPPAEDPGYGKIWYNPDTNDVWATLSDSDARETYDAWKVRLQRIPKIGEIRIEAETGPSDQTHWIKIGRCYQTGCAAGCKIASNWADMPFRAGGALTGGPSALSNTIVGSLLGGGIGYLGGAAAEHLFPERFVERGRLRKSLGLMGLLAGAVPGLYQSSVAHRTQTNAAKAQGVDAPSYLESLATPTNNQLVDQDVLRASRQRAEGAFQDRQMPYNPPNQPVPESSSHNFLTRDELATGAKVDPSRVSAPEPGFLRYSPPPVDKRDRTLERMLKAGGEETAMSRKFAQTLSGLDAPELKPVPLDAFGNVIWNDVGNYVRAANNPYGAKSPHGSDDDPMHTPPAVGAAVAGVVSGIATMNGDPEYLHPKHFMRGLAAAGVDAVTARVAGGVLGALGGLKPEAQQQLQNMGIWGGFIRGVAQSIFN